MVTKLQAVRSLLSREGGDAALISRVPDIRWATGFSGSNGLLLIGRESATLVTDGRYEAQAAREVGDIQVLIAKGNLFDYLDEEGILPRTGRICIQSDHLTLSHFERLRDAFPDVQWLAQESMLARLTAPKSGGALEAIRAAQRITDDVFSHLLDIIRPGMTEKELSAEIVYQHLQRGAEGMAFDPIVASGKNASLPHARPSDCSIEAGELLLIDMGCVWNGYACDMTRTVAIGNVSDEARNAYGVVHDALEHAVAAARSGLSTKALDAVARDFIEEAGYGENFSHSLGHGVGLQAHEWPRVSYSTDDELPEGVVVALEPGVYLPEKFGVRIEDMVHLNPGGCEVLASAPKNLVQL